MKIIVDDLYNYVIQKTEVNQKLQSLQRSGITCMRPSLYYLKIKVNNLLQHHIDLYDTKSYLTTRYNTVSCHMYTSIVWYDIIFIILYNSILYQMK